MFENWKVIAHRDLDFKSDDGKEIKGVQIFLARPSQDRGWHGVEVSKFFIRSDSEVLSRPLPKPGTDIRIAFNRFGKISVIEAV